MATIEELAGRVFTARDVAHREHWRTGSFAAHMALGDFYDDVIEAVDSLVEAYQGEFGKIGPFDARMDKMVPDIVKHLKADLAWIADNRDEIADENSSIENEIDSLLAVYQTAIYKLVNLR